MAVSTPTADTAAVPGRTQLKSRLKDPSNPTLFRTLSHRLSILPGSADTPRVRAILSPFGASTLAMSWFVCGWIRHEVEGCCRGDHCRKRGVGKGVVRQWKHTYKSVSKSKKQEGVVNSLASSRGALLDELPMYRFLNSVRSYLCHTYSKSASRWARFCECT